MGINNLIQYINKSNTLAFPQIEHNNFIYRPTIAYYDFTYKLIDIYNNFKGKTITDLISHTITSITSIFKKLSDYNEVYIFLDRKYTPSYIDCEKHNLKFFDYLPQPKDFDKKDLLHATPLIKRKYINSLKICPDADLSGYVRCLCEFNSIYSTSTHKLSKYVSISYLISNESNPEIIFNYQKLLSYGWYRYIILRGGKKLTIKERHISKLPYIHALAEKYKTDNISKLLLLFNGNKEKLSKQFYSKIPFITLIYAFPIIIEKLKPKYPHIRYFGCEVEADMAISKHIHTYTRNAFPLVITCDTDLLALLCDVNCVIKLELRGNIPQSVIEASHIHNHNQSTYASFLINPPKFFQSIFHTNLHPTLIKLLLILKGTDYNRFSPQSSIHILSFDDILKKLSLESFSELTIDRVYQYYADELSLAKDSLYAKSTALALNIYLNDNIEQYLHEILPSEDLSLNLFLKQHQSHII